MTNTNQNDTILDTHSVRRRFDVIVQAMLADSAASASHSGEPYLKWLEDQDAKLIS
jgi:hypothetical protein